MTHFQRYECGVCGCHTYDRARCQNCASPSLRAVTETPPPNGAAGNGETPLQEAQQYRQGDSNRPGATAGFGTITS